MVNFATSISEGPAAVILESNMEMETDSYEILLTAWEEYVWDGAKWPEGVPL
jgi:hypothetical protein